MGSKIEQNGLDDFKNNKQEPDMSVVSSIRKMQENDKSFLSVEQVNMLQFSNRCYNSKVRMPEDNPSFLLSASPMIIENSNRVPYDNFRQNQ